MDGLFLDSEPQWHEAETLMMRENGYDWQPEDQLNCLGGPLRRVAEYMSKCLEQRKTPQELEAMIIAEMTDRLSRMYENRKLTSKIEKNLLLSSIF